MLPAKHSIVGAIFVLGIVIASSIALRDCWLETIVESELEFEALQQESQDISVMPVSTLDYPPEFFKVRDEFESIPDARKRIAVGNLALNVEALHNSSSYKQDVVNLLIDLMMDPDTESATRAYIPEALERFGLLDVPVSEVAENQLRGILNKQVTQLTTTDIELLEAFEINGYETVVNDIVEGAFYIDGSKYSFEGSISEIPTVAWSALLVNVRLGDENAINQAITIIENSEVTDKLFLISNLGRIPNQTIRNYLAYYVFSDEQVQVSFDNANPFSPLAWYAASAMENQFQDFPFEISDSTTEEEKLSLISQIRGWLESHPELDIN